MGTNSPDPSQKVIIRDKLYRYFSCMTNSVYHATPFDMQRCAILGSTSPSSLTLKLSIIAMLLCALRIVPVAKV
jgi:hypothetical protein